MPFGVATVITNGGKRTSADRLRPAPTRNPPVYIAAGTGATAAGRTAAAADAALSSELPEGRTLGADSTLTTTVTGDTFQVTGQIVMAAPRNVDEAGLFDAAAAGNMHLSATMAVLALLSGDALVLTFQDQFL